MELLLNVIWMTLAMGAFWIFLHSRPATGRHVSYHKSLIALACVTLLLFPIVSASDDLHPTQALVEDATKRIQHAVSPQQLPGSHSAIPLVPILLAISLLLALALWQPYNASDLQVSARDGYLFLCVGRAPPALFGH
jgi:hypothetical protein